MKDNDFLKFHLQNNPEEISVLVIGAGGNGSAMMSALVKLNLTLIALNRPGLKVTLMDDDVITESNIGRQLFFPSDIGLSKSRILIERINRSYGFDWEASQERLTEKNMVELYSKKTSYNITISCVDNIKTRIVINDRWEAFKQRKLVNAERTPILWMDLGNGNDFGQVVINARWDSKSSSELFPDLFNPANESDDTPSCSLAEALEKQDLFINQTLCSFAGEMLSKILRAKEGAFNHRAIFLNLAESRSIPLEWKN